MRPVKGNALVESFVDGLARRTGAGKMPAPQSQCGEAAGKMPAPQRRDGESAVRIPAPHGSSAGPAVVRASRPHFVQRGAARERPRVNACQRGLGDTAPLLSPGPAGRRR
jgi:hypothetical protein